MIDKPKMKLVPTNDDIDADHGSDAFLMFEQVCLTAGVCGGIGESVFSAIDKHAPTVQEVDLDSMKKDAYTPDDPFERAEARGYNQALEDLKEKYTKIYAEVKE